MEEFTPENIKLLNECRNMSTQSTRASMKIACTKEYKTSYLYSSDDCTGNTTMEHVSQFGVCEPIIDNQYIRVDLVNAIEMVEGKAKFITISAYMLGLIVSSNLL